MRRRTTTGEHTVLGNGRHFLFFLHLFLLVVRCSPLHLLVPVRPRVNIRARKGQVTEFTAQFFFVFRGKACALGLLSTLCCY